MIMTPFENQKMSEKNARVLTSRADLHVHSKYSNRPSEWFLRRIGAPESFVEPRAIYDACKAAGMDYVTISDHNCIQGALEISDLPGTFLSTELTTYFPEDRCKIHCLVCGISSRQFDDLQDIRSNIYELRDYLLKEGIAHIITHPLFRVNDKLSIEHVEKLLVMFNHFEGINGTRDALASQVTRAVFGSLDRECVEILANRHNLEPAGESPWVKHLTGGSDDHCGLYVASAFTQTPKAPTVYGFLEHVKNGNHQPGGNAGNSLKLADSLLAIGCDYYSSRLKNLEGESMLGGLLKKIAGQESQPTGEGRLKAVARKLVGPMVKKRKLKQLPEFERELLTEFSKLATEGLFSDNGRREPGGYRSRFTTAASLGHHLGYAFMVRCSAQLGKGSLVGALQSAASLVPIGIGLTPYLTAFGTQHKDDFFLRAVADHFGCGEKINRPVKRRAWLTDTFDDVNGVAKTIRTLAALAEEQGVGLTVVTCLEADPVASFPIKNFKPVGMYDLPDYPGQKVAFPPFMEILAWLEEADIDELLISTPGPVGLIGVTAAKLLGIPARGIYHTDFPRYIQNWTDDDTMAELAKRLMKWFYGRMEVIYAPTRAYVHELEAMGFSADKLRVLPRGVDLKRFSPAYRQSGFWEKHSLNGAFKFIYVGRLSEEKNVVSLLKAQRILKERGVKADLAVVGDGPCFHALAKEYKDETVVFTGYLHGEELSRAYASADALVFPSLTDTFGNVVLEAHASGLPAIVSDQGGPQEIVRVNDSGLIVDATDPGCLAEAMIGMVTNEETYQDFCRRAMATAQTSQWEDVLMRL
ncbi:MAG: glycosyltransferase [Lentisphaeria bacterium]|nr:glycosyltransferase [Lentisphaeria bacterium]